MLVKGNEFWVTKEKKRLRIRDIDDGHLVNILRFLRRRCEAIRTHRSLQMLEGPGPRGDAACMAFDAELDHMESRSWRQFLPKDRRDQVRNLEREAAKRGLKWQQ